MIPGLLRSIGEIIRVDADAVAADKARGEVEEIPLGPSRGKHVAGVDAELVEDRREFVHERDVEIALRVLDHLGRFGDLDRRRLVQAGLDDRAINRRDHVEQDREPGAFPESDRQRALRQLDLRRIARQLAAAVEAAGNGQQLAARTVGRQRAVRKLRQRHVEHHVAPHAGHRDDDRVVADPRRVDAPGRQVRERVGPAERR